MLSMLTIYFDKLSHLVVGVPWVDALAVICAVKGVDVAAAGSRQCGQCTGQLPCIMQVCLTAVSQQADWTACGFDALAGALCSTSRLRV
jgi:hypothetical protein